jgi:hypothetical protein
MRINLSRSTSSTSAENASRKNLRIGTRTLIRKVVACVMIVKTKKISSLSAKTKTATNGNQREVQKIRRKKNATNASSKVSKR